MIPDPPKKPRLNTYSQQTVADNYLSLSTFATLKIKKMAYNKENTITNEGACCLTIGQTVT